MSLLTLFNTSELWPFNVFPSSSLYVNYCLVTCILCVVRCYVSALRLKIEAYVNQIIRINGLLFPGQ